jgi:predicted ester cyclase
MHLKDSNQPERRKDMESNIEELVREIEHLARDGDTAICVGTMSGTHEGTLLGVPPTGRKVEWRQCHLYRFDENGRAVEHDAIRDDVSLLRQFGEDRD